MNISRFVVGFLSVNTYLLEDKNEFVIIDPGVGVDFLSEKIEASKGKLKYIVLTHFHFDHTQGVAFLKKKFKKVEILIHKNEKEYIEHYFDGQKLALGSPSKNASAYSRETYVKFIPDRFLEEGDEIRIGESGMLVVHTPGHSAGSICLFGDGFVFSGDTLFSDGVGRTDLPGSSFVDMEKSLKKLKDKIKPGTIVYPGHGEVFKR